MSGTVVRARRARLAAWLLAVCLASQAAIAAGTAVTKPASPTASVPSQVEPKPRTEPREDDDANMRRDAWRAWYEGDASPRYRKFLFESAQAERQARKNRASRSKSSAMSAITAAVPAWLNLGPTRADFQLNGPYSLYGIDSGRLASIVVHPADVNQIYVATAGGGVWKTTNGGLTWIPITDSVGQLAVGSLEMDPQDPNTLYLGLGDFADNVGAGVGAFLKSTDAGATWSSGVVLQHQSGSTTLTATYVKQILSSPVAPGLLLAATDVGLFRSVDSGTTWSYVDLPGIVSASPKVWSLAWTGGSNFALSLVDDGAPNGGGAVFVSSDAGAHWIRASGPSKPSGVARISLAAAPSNRAVVYALAAEATGFNLADVFRSTDGGSTWLPLNADTRNLTNPNAESARMADLFVGQAWYDQMVLVHPTDPSLVYFGGQLFLARTTDGGGTYSQTTNWLGQYGLPYVHADFQCGTFDSAGNLYVGTDGGIFKSPEGGQTWISALNVGIVSHLVYSVGSSLANRDAVIGGIMDDGTRVRSGATSTFNQTIGGDGFGSNVHATNPNRMLGSLYFNQVYRSNDGGASFSPAYSGIDTNNGVFFTKIVPAPGDATGNTVYTLTYTNVYTSTDYAGHWTALGTAGLPATGLRNVGASKSSPQVLGLVAISSQVFLSSDGGSNWAPTAPLPNSSAALSSIWFDTSNSQIIYVTSVARVAGAAHIWKSIDGGSSWTALGASGTGLPQVPVNLLVNDPNNTLRLYAGTVLGLYQSDDGGETWSAAGSGLPLANVTDIYVAPDSSFVRVSTYGRGFWELATPPSADPISLTPDSFSSGTVGVAYGPASLAASGGTAPYSFSVTAGALAGGLSLSSAGVLSGTPNMAGSYTFRVTATDSTPAASGGPLSGSRVYVVTVLASSSITLMPSSLPGGAVQSIYSPQIITAAGGTWPYSFAVTSGALPGGLTLSGSGVLSGTPSQAGTFAFTVTATDSTPPVSGGPHNGQQSYSMAIFRGTQSVNFAQLGNRYLGDPDFSVSATATSGLAVVFSSQTPPVCTLSGAVVHLATLGTCTIVASQGGDANYFAAQQAQSFSVLLRDTMPPTVVALQRDILSPTMSDELSYTLTFSEPVNFVAIEHFTLATTGLTGASIVDVYGQGATWQVTVNDGRGSGTLRLDYVGGPDVGDLAGNPLTALPVQGETYQVDKNVTVIGAGQGRPDAAFGSNGIAPFSDAPIATTPAVAVLPDGRILAAGQVACQGTSTGFSCGLQLARYLADGTADATFGVNGRVLTTLTRVVFLDRLRVNGDGSIFVDGVRSAISGSTFLPFVARFANDGTPVTSFGVNGLASLDSLPLGSTLIGSTVDSGGRVLLAGSTTTVVGQGTDAFVLRLTPAGLLETSFGAGGVARFAISTTGNRNDRATDVAVLLDGRILVGGRTTGSTGAFDFLLLRLNSTGVLDPTFGTGGVASTRFAAAGSNAGRRLVLQPDGQIVLMGTLPAQQCGIARFQASGVLDTTYGSGGKVTLPQLQNCADITWQPDGKLVLTGWNFRSDADLMFGALERLLADGAVDPTFGTNGLIEITSYDLPARAAVTASGSLVTSLVIEDPADGLQKSHVVQLAARLAQATTTAVANVTPSNAVTGQLYTVTVSVAATSGVPDGAVKVSDDLGTSCTVVALANGTGSCTLAAPAAGNRILTALYSGSPSFQTSTGSRTYVVAQASTSTSLVSSLNPAPVGTPVTFSARVRASAPGAGIPTGSVTFLNRGNVVGTAPVDAAGNAAFVTAALPVGTAKLVARFSPDANFKGSSSGELEQKIEKLPSVQFSASSLKVAESAGSVTLTVNRGGSVAGPVTVTYTSSDGTAKTPSDYVAANGTLSWAAGDGTAKTVTIPIVADGVPESAETFSVTLTAPNGATLGNTVSSTIAIAKN